MYPPPTATYTESPAPNAEVSTPFIKPLIKPIPSSPLFNVSPAITPAGILKGFEASAGKTPATFPAVPDPVI